MDVFKRLFALIGENGQGIGTSSFADWVQNVSKLDLPTDEKLAADELIDSCYAQLEEGIYFQSINMLNNWSQSPNGMLKYFTLISVTGLQFLNNEGSALYSIESKANHSCIPNAQATFPHANHRLHLVAIRDVQCGMFQTMWKTISRFKIIDFRI